MKSEKLKRLLQYAKGILFFFGMPVVLFLVAGSWTWWQGWVYIGVSYAASILSRALLTKIHPDLVKERAAFAEKEDTKKWDKVLMPLVAIILPAVYFITAGLDHRFHWSGPVSTGLYIPAFILTLAGFAFNTWAMLENQYFAAVVRIQTDRGQKVVEGGPYHFVRHPGYASSYLVGLMFPIMIGSWWSYIPVVIMIVLLIIRTGLEDKTLHAELPGYVEFTQKTRYRLFPGIW